MPAITLISAAAQSTNRVRVVTSSEPKHSGISLQGDALNPRTWRVIRDDTGNDLPVGSVIMVNATTYDLVVGEPFGGVMILHYVTTYTLIAIDNTPMVDASWATFRGVVAADKTGSQGGSVDLLNAPVPGSDRLGGTFRVVSGDYARQSGADLYTKLILRRLLSQKRSFAHLQDYGAGLKLKEPMPIGSISRLKAEIERQVRLEPETVDTRVSITLSTSGIELVTIQSTIQSQSAPVTIALTPDFVADFGPGALPNPPPVPPPTPAARDGGWMNEDFGSPFSAGG